MSRYESPSRHDPAPDPDQNQDFEPFADFGGPIRPPADRERRVLSVMEIARYCGVPSDEVLDWIETGRLVASYLRHGSYRIAAGDFMAFFTRYAFLI